MRGKRSKQYRKLMEQYSMTFGLREPYQILVDAEMVQDATRFKMDLAASLQRTVHGQTKPMITQCEIRKLYARKDQPGIDEAIDLAKTFERRRCGHHPVTHPEPLETTECMQSVVDSKSTGENKHRYVVASQSQNVRKMLRGVRGVPLIYIKRSVMILEPMTDESVSVRASEERSKFRAELKKTLGKRKREEKDEDKVGQEAIGHGPAPGDKKDKKKGVKGANPLSMKKKKRPQDAQKKATAKEAEAAPDAPAKRKRRRKTKPEDGATAGAAESSTLASGQSNEDS